MNKFDIKSIKKITTDVLVIGGSGAAVSAAVTANKLGADVVLVSKGKIGKSGNAIMAGGGFSVDGESAYEICGEKDANTKFDKNALFDSIVKESYFISDQKIVEQYVDESPKIVNEFLKCAKRANQKFIFAPGSNSWISAGLSWGKTSAEAIKENPEIEIYEDFFIIDLLKNDDKIVGAIGIDIYDGELKIFNSKSTIIATGGFQPCTLKNTVTDMTGDGIGMAFRAGASLADMEFILAFATALFPSEAKGSIYPFVMEFNMPKVSFLVRDGNKEIIDIPEEVIKISRGKKLSKLISMYYYGYSIFNGNGTKDNGVYLDYSLNDKEILKQSLDEFFDRFSNWHKRGFYKGDNMEKVVNQMLSSGLIEVGLGYEYSMGGLFIDENMNTVLPGLFAAGEVTSGVFGANRVGDGLTEMLCQGYRAGLSAVSYSNDNSLENVDEYYLENIIERISQPFNNDENISSIFLHHKIESICDDGFNVIRTEEKLKNALSEIRKLKNCELKNVSIKAHSMKYNYEFIDYLQAENLLICVEAALISAINRKESRGSHIRADYPNVDNDNFLYRSIITNSDNNMNFETQKPNVTKLKLPNGKKNNIIEYFLDKDLNYKR